MNALEEITQAILKLCDADRAALRVWMDEEAEWEEWDKQIERDAAAGKFKRFAEEARAEYHAGLTTEL